MDALDTLLTRRSVRAFTAEPITADQVQTILTAGMYAPSACNQQPWHFITVTDRARLDMMARTYPFANMFAHVQLAVAVCADLTLETCPGNWVIDCSNATENMLLAAHALGLGGVWIGIHPNEVHVKNIEDLFHLPGFVKPLSLAAFGHPAQPLPVVDRFLPDRIHRETW
jgi:nitroreductase